MVPPRTILYILANLGIRRDILTGQELCRDILSRVWMTEIAPRELHTRHHGVQISAPCIVAFVEVVEVDVRRFPGIRRSTSS